VPLAGYLQVCNYDSDCIPNAYCKEQKYCQCKKDFIIYVTDTHNFSCLEGEDTESLPAAFTRHMKEQDGPCGSSWAFSTSADEKLQQKL
jgi:hypothetical protein